MNKLVYAVIVAVVLLVMFRATGHIGNNVIETMAPSGILIIDAADAEVVTMEWFEPVSSDDNTGIIEIEPYIHHEIHTDEARMLHKRKRRQP